MKKFITYVKGAAMAALFLSSAKTFAQSEVGEFLKSSPADATKLANAYLTPLFKGIGVGLNTGWNHTANAKNLGRFELKVTFSGANVPDEDKTFDFMKIGLSNNVQPASGSSSITPTLGGSGAGARIQVGGPGGSTFTLPGGADLPLNSVPAATLQGTVGLIKGIDVSLRLTPKIKLGDFGTVNMIGGGLKLELLPLIAGKKTSKLLPFDLAVALGYTQFKYNKGLSVQPESGALPNGVQNSDFSNQRMELKFSGINAELILSKKLLFFTPFASVGFNTSKTDGGLKGNYPITTNYTGVKTYTTFTDPVGINQTDISGMRANLGFQLNLAFFRVYTSYSLAEYNTFNAGIGLGIGK